MRTEGGKEGQMDEDRGMDRRADGERRKDRWMDRRTDGWREGRIDG